MYPFGSFFFYLCSFDFFLFLLAFILFFLLWNYPVVWFSFLVSTCFGSFSVFYVLVPLYLHIYCTYISVYEIFYAFVSFYIIFLCLCYDDFCHLILHVFDPLFPIFNICVIATFLRLFFHSLRIIFLFLMSF